MNHQQHQSSSKVKDEKPFTKEHHQSVDLSTGGSTQGTWVTPQQMDMPGGSPKQGAKGQDLVRVSISIKNAENVWPVLMHVEKGGRDNIA
jgi:hypothetical protein